MSKALPRFLIILCANGLQRNAYRPISLETMPRAHLKAHLAGLPRREPTARYLTNTRGRATTSAETVLGDLAQAVAHTVHWYDATRLMGELGTTCAIETQPGHVLTRLLPSAAPTVAAISLQDSGLAAAARRANRLLDTEDRPQTIART